MQKDSTMEKLNEKLTVMETATTLAYAIDRRDFALAKDQFVDMVTLDYTSLFGGEVEKLPAQTIIDRWSSLLPKLKMTQHTLSNFMVDLNGDKATCISYVQGFHYLPYADGGSRWTVFGHYTQQMRKTKNGWKISYMKLTATHETGNGNLLSIAANTPTMQKLSFASEAIRMVGALFLPASYKAGEKIPAIVVTGSWITVKEQMPMLYAAQLARQGFAAFIFDFRGFGESEGEPRQYESPAKKIQDIKSAITFLEALPQIDKSKIGGLGVCASSGYMASVAAEDERLKSFAAVAPWLHNNEIVKTIYGGGEGVKDKIRSAEKAIASWNKEGKSTMVPACSAADATAAMYGNWDYYLNSKRGAIPEWKNQFNVMSWKEWLTFDPIAIASKIKIPVYLIHSEEAAIPQGAKQFYDNLGTKTKKITWTTGNQFDFYDNEKNVLESSKMAADWFRATLT